LGKTPGIESRSPGKLVAGRYILFKLATSPIKTIMGLSLNSGIWIRDDRLIKSTPDTDND